jgi:hypothetical protein
MFGPTLKDKLMSKLAEFRALEQKLAAQLAELDSLKNDNALKLIHPTEAASGVYGAKQRR